MDVLRFVGKTPEVVVVTDDGRVGLHAQRSSTSIATGTSSRSWTFGASTTSNR